MSAKWTTLALPISLALTGASIADTGEQAGGIAFSGHWRSILARSRTQDAAARPFVVDANRLRLEWTGPIAPALALEIQYDQEVAVGARPGIEELTRQAALRAPTFWDLADSYVERDHVLARHRLHRGNLTWSAGGVDLRLGRQRIAWGAGRFWNPLDQLNAFSATALEPGERLGVDALLLEYRPGALTALSFVHAPVHGRRDHDLLRWAGNRAGLDFALTGGRTPAGALAGVDLVGQWGGAGWHGGWTLTRKDTGSHYTRLLLGADYAFISTLTLSAELYRDGAGETEPARYDLAALAAGNRETVGRHYAGLFVSYELTPLLKWSNWLAFNLDDRSRYLSPRLTWSARTNLDVAMGAQWFSGETGTEFNLRSNVLFAQVQWFF